MVMVVEEQNMKEKKKIYRKRYATVFNKAVYVLSYLPYQVLTFCTL